MSGSNRVALHVPGQFGVPVGQAIALLELEMPFDPTSGSAASSRIVAAGSTSGVATPHTTTRTGWVALSSLFSCRRIRFGAVSLRRSHRVGRLNAKRLMTPHAPQLRGPAMQRHPFRATRADGIRSERRLCDDCPLARPGVRDFEAVVREDHCAAMHNDDRFLGTGAEHRVPRATAERALDIEHQTGPPFCGRYSLPHTHRTPRPNLKGTARSAHRTVVACVPLYKTCPFPPCAAKAL